MLGPSPYTARILVTSFAALIGFHTVAWARRWVEAFLAFHAQMPVTPKGLANLSTSLWIEQPGGNGSASRPCSLSGQRVDLYRMIAKVTPVASIDLYFPTYSRHSATRNPGVVASSRSPRSACLFVYANCGVPKAR
jgi:hypothetical protein